MIFSYHSWANHTIMSTLIYKKNSIRHVQKNISNKLKVRKKIQHRKTDPKVRMKIGNPKYAAKSTVMERRKTKVK